MSFEIMSFASDSFRLQAVSEVVACNDFTAKFGLVLSQAQAVSLVEIRTDALKANDRIEFGGGIIDKLIKEFCDSPYVSQSSYMETITELIEIFYLYKNESLDLIDDDELIKFMKSAYDGVCNGSLSLLADRELSNMAHNLRFNKPLNYVEIFDDLDDDEKEEKLDEY